MKFPTVQEVIARLDEKIIGQKEAKKRVAIAVRNHFYEIARDGKPSSKNNIILLGPTGSGKSYLAQLLAELFGLDYLLVNCGSLVPSGFEGVTLSKTYAQLLDKCEGNKDRAAHAIIILDEIDKRRATGSPEDLGVKIQHELLPITQGTEVAGIPTTNQLFIATGAFVGLTDIVRKRGNNLSLPEDDAVALLTTEDFQAYGLIPEFTGRFDNRLPLQKLSVEDFLRMIRNNEESFVAAKKRLFEEHGFELVLTEDAIDAMAEKAYQQNTGARALGKIISDACDGMQVYFEKLYLQGRRRIEITKEVILGTASPRAVPSLKFKNTAAQQVREKMDELFERLKPSSDSKAKKPKADYEMEDDDDTPSGAKGGAKSEDSGPKTTGGQNKGQASAQNFGSNSQKSNVNQGAPGQQGPTQFPFNLYPGTGGSYFTEEEKRAVQELAKEKKNPPKQARSIFGQMADFIVYLQSKGLSLSGVGTWFGSNSISSAATWSLVAYFTLMALACVGHSLSWSLFLRYALFRDEADMWHLTAGVVGILFLGSRRYRTPEKFAEWALVATIAFGVYVGIIALGARQDIFSFRHAMLSWVTFLDHALWREGFVSGWNYIAAAIGGFLIVFAVDPAGPTQPPSQIVAGVWRRLTGRGPSESQSSSHPLS